MKVRPRTAPGFRVVPLKSRATKFSVMKENLEHHIEEEEGEMFGQARQLMDADEMEECKQAISTGQAAAPWLATSCCAS